MYYNEIKEKREDIKNIVTISKIHKKGSCKKIEGSATNQKNGTNPTT